MIVLHMGCVYNLSMAAILAAYNRSRRTGTTQLTTETLPCLVALPGGDPASSFLLVF